MRRQLWRTMRAMLTVAAPYMLVVIPLAKPGLSLVYADRYAGYEHILYLWMVLWVASVTAYPLETGLMLARRPDLLFRSRLMAAIGCLSFCAFSVPRWGIEGTMVALVLGQSLAMSFGYYYLNKATRRAS
jgi:O-antigen/teichoic acid export membrane protein